MIPHAKMLWYFVNLWLCLVCIPNNVGFRNYTHQQIQKEKIREKVQNIFVQHNEIFVPLIPSLLSLRAWAIISN